MECNGVSLVKPYVLALLRLRSTASIDCLILELFFPVLGPCSREKCQNRIRKAPEWSVCVGAKWCACTTPVCTERGRARS